MIKQMFLASSVLIAVAGMIEAPSMPINDRHRVILEKRDQQAVEIRDWNLSAARVNGIKREERV